MYHTLLYSCMGLIYFSNLGLEYVYSILICVTYINPLKRIILVFQRCLPLVFRKTLNLMHFLYTIASRFQLRTGLD